MQTKPPLWTQGSNFPVSQDLESTSHLVHRKPNDIESPPDGTERAPLRPRGMCLAFKNISYTVRHKDFATKITENRKVLNDCTGILRPGTLNAIMGPSGGGKTSLLDVLAHRKKGTRVSGKVLVNGRPCIRKVFMHQSGYVVQDDIVMGTLTVRENLMFSAELRLPDTISQDDKRKRVDEVMEELGLGKVADQMIGNELVRGISGGERKRVNVGMELITSPSILFLDEPTTGLDAAMSLSVVRTLKKLSEKGRTVVMSIHQPQAKIFALFDSVTLLAEGNVVYHGPSSHCIPYFDKVGFGCEHYNNPADFILDVLTGEEPPKSEDMTAGSSRQDSDVAEAKAKREMEARKMLHEAYSVSEMATQATLAVENEDSGVTLGSEVKYAEYTRTYGSSWTKQIGLEIFFAFVTGLIFYNIGQQNTLETVMRDRSGFLYFVVVHLQFSNLSAIDVFLKERVIFIHEKTSGYYYTSAYFVSKLLSDMIPVRVIPTLIFGTILYFMAGLQRTAEKFFWFEFVIVLQSVVSASACFAISAKFSNAGIANLVTTTLFVFMILFNGLLVSINSWPSYTRWLGYLSFCNFARELEDVLDGLALRAVYVTYSYELLLQNEFEGLVFPFACGTVNPCTGEELLGPGYLDISTDPPAIKVMAMLIMIVGCLALAYVFLARLRRK